MRQNDEYKPEFTSATSPDMLITFGLLLDNGLQKDTMLSPGPAPGGGGHSGRLLALSESQLPHFQNQGGWTSESPSASCSKTAELKHRLLNPLGPVRSRSSEILFLEATKSHLVVPTLATKVGDGAERCLFGHK